MKRHHLKVLLSILLTVLILLVPAITTVSCSAETEPTSKIGVVVTILPQAEFAERIGGDKVEVMVMVPSGASPHTYEPTPSQMTTLSEAELYAKVGSGVEFELTWLDNLIAQNEDMLVVDCSAGIELQESISTDSHEDDEHEAESDDDEHEHGAMDPHIWMSPQNAQIMAQNIADGLIQVDLDNQAYYEQNRDDYLQELADLDDEIRDGLSGVTNRIFMVYHPAFGYFARNYDLTMLPIEDEGKEPTAAGIQHLIEQATEHNIKVVFVEPQFNPESAEVIADEIGGEVIFINPLAQDYIDNLHDVAEKMITAME